MLINLIGFKSRWSSGFVSSLDIGCFFFDPVRKMELDNWKELHNGSLTTGGPRLVRFLGFWKNRTKRNSYYLVLHSQFPLVRILLHSNPTSTNFIPIALKFVLVEIVLVETALVGDPLYLGCITLTMVTAIHFSYTYSLYIFSYAFQNVYQTFGNACKIIKSERALWVASNDKYFILY